MTTSTQPRPIDQELESSMWMFPPAELTDLATARQNLAKLASSAPLPDMAARRRIRDG
jgi:hypothetical protein